MLQRVIKCGDEVVLGCYINTTAATGMTEYNITSVHLPGLVCWHGRARCWLVGGNWWWWGEVVVLCVFLYWGRGEGLVLCGGGGGGEHRGAQVGGRGGAGQSAVGRAVWAGRGGAGPR